MVVLGIETTCDETAAAVVERPEHGPGKILSNIVLSQIGEHAAFGGVVPEIAARAHVEALDLVIAGRWPRPMQLRPVDGIAAAAGPGLIGGLIVGLTTAKAIALVTERPVAVNHLEAHALTARLTDGMQFPYCLFLASGGHTQIVAVRGVGDYVRLGTTVDDAIGEAFDKTAKLLGLPLSGRPAGGAGSPRRRCRPLCAAAAHGGPDRCDFSLSGLKTALRLEAEKIAPISSQDVRDLCASFQQAVMDVVADRLRSGLKLFRAQFGFPTALVAAGGVAANDAIRSALQRVAFEAGTTLVVPPAELCTDNGAMIAWAGAERLTLGLRDTLDTAPLPRWPLADVRGPLTIRPVPDWAGQDPTSRQRRQGRARRSQPDGAPMAFERIAIVGAGAWGTALANALGRAGRTVTLATRDPAGAEQIARTRESPRLPGRKIDDRVAIAATSAAVLAAQDAILLAVPAQQLRAVAGMIAPALAAGMPVIACAKGIERGTVNS